MDFFECASLALDTAAHGKDLANPRVNVTEEDGREQNEFRVALNAVKFYQKELLDVSFRLAALDSNYWEYTASIINDRLKKEQDVSAKMVSNVQNCSKVTLIPHSESKDSGGTKPWMKPALGALLMFTSTFTQPMLNYQKFVAEMRERASHSSLYISEVSSYTPASTLGKRPGPSEKEKLGWFSDLSSSAKDIGKRLLEGKSCAKPKWVCYIPMRKVSSGNRVRSTFGITRSKMELNVAGWRVRYE